LVGHLIHKNTGTTGQRNSYRADSRRRKGWINGPAL
jgi:hypothetical protein